MVYSRKKWLFWKKQRILCIHNCRSRLKYSTFAMTSYLKSLQVTIRGCWAQSENPGALSYCDFPPSWIISSNIGTACSTLFLTKFSGSFPIFTLCWALSGFLIASSWTSNMATPMQKAPKPSSTIARQIRQQAMTATWWMISTCRRATGQASGLRYGNVL